MRKDILRNSYKFVPADVEKCDLETEKENQPGNFVFK